MSLFFTFLASAVPGIVGTAFMLQALDAAEDAGVRQERRRHSPREPFDFNPPELADRSAALAWMALAAVAFLFAGATSAATIGGM